MAYKHILTTTDFSEESYRALQTADSLAAESGAKVTLLNILPDWVVPDSMYEFIPDPKQIEEYRSKLKQSADKKLKETAQKYFKKATVNIETIASIESIAQEINNFAKKNACDLIVISTHGRGAIGTLVLGSVTQRVIHDAPCPVLIVPKAAKA